MKPELSSFIRGKFSLIILLPPKGVTSPHIIEHGGLYYNFEISRFSEYCHDIVLTLKNIYEIRICPRYINYDAII